VCHDDLATDGRHGHDYAGQSNQQASDGHGLSPSVVMALVWWKMCRTRSDHMGMGGSKHVREMGGFVHV
jgi:hypothetical protein